MTLSKDFIKNLIEFWERDTEFLSYHDPSHPIVIILQRIGERNTNELVVKEILEYIRENESWFFSFIHLFIEEKDRPKIPEKSLGVFNDMRRIWIDWGIKNKLLKM